MPISIDLIVFVIACLLIVALMAAGKLPRPEVFHAFLDALNSRGGNIFILAIASAYFFSHSLRIFYFLFEATRQGFISQDNAFALMALQFATSTAFGGAFGALLKTMTGESSNRNRSTDKPDPVAAPVTP